MPSAKGTVPLPGSERKSLAGARKIGRIDPNERIRVTLIVKSRSSKNEQLAIEKLGSQMPRRRVYLTRDELETRYGASRTDLMKVEVFARDNSLDIVEVSAAKRSVVLSGTISQVSDAFGVKLEKYTHPSGVYRGCSGPIQLPPELATVVQAVLGLDSRPQAKAHFRIARRAVGGITYTPPQVGQIYDYPSQINGSGQTIGIIELGGGYNPKDLGTYFSGIGIQTPSVVSISVDGAVNAPTGDPSGRDAEVMLDIEVAGSLAPGADVAVYFAPNTDAGFVDAVLAAVHDTQHKPSVISVSWGDSESKWTQQGMQALDQALQDAVLLGVSVCVAAGDGGSSDGVSDGLAHVDFPASSQYAIACGGTRLRAAGGKVTSEVVWNDEPSGGATGGGVSNVFPLPSWQSNAHVPPSANPGGRIGRGIPDVSGDADPSTGYLVLVDGDMTPIGGTSAVAPLWAGLIALFNQKLGKSVGYLNPVLYETIAATGAFRDIVTGNNGAYNARVGWDACTGWGSPDGAKLLSALSSG